MDLGSLQLVWPLHLAAFISLDEVDHAYAFWPKMAGILLIILGAFLYMRLTHRGLRCLFLLACAFLALAVMSGGAGYYWQTHDINLSTGESYPVSTPVNWSAILLATAAQAGFVTLFLLVPFPLALVRWIYNRIHLRVTSP